MSFLFALPDGSVRLKATLVGRFIAARTRLQRRGQASTSTETPRPRGATCVSPCNLPSHLLGAACAALIPVLLLAAVAVASPAVSSDTEYDRRTYYSQPMGLSPWKKPAQTPADLARMIEEHKVNATAEQYAQALYDAGWIPQPDPQLALAFIRSLHPGPIENTSTVRTGRLLRSYRNGAPQLNSGFYQVVKQGEVGFFDDQGNLVIRQICMNVAYPERVAVLPAAEEKAPPPPPALVEAPPAPEAPPLFPLAPPPSFKPPPRHSVSPSRPLLM